jgi:hypothetical protein
VLPLPHEFRVDWILDSLAPEEMGQVAACAGAQTATNMTQNRSWQSRLMGWLYSFYRGRCWPCLHQVPTALAKHSQSLLCHAGAGVRHPPASPPLCQCATRSRPPPMAEVAILTSPWGRRNAAFLSDVNHWIIDHRVSAACKALTLHPEACSAISLLFSQRK